MILRTFNLLTQGNAKAGLREEELLWRNMGYAQQVSFASCVFGSAFSEFYFFCIVSQLWFSLRNEIENWIITSSMNLRMPRREVAFKSGCCRSSLVYEH